MAEKKKMYIVSKYYTFSALFVILMAFVLMPVYPEIFLRMVTGLLLVISIFFGFASNEMHCKYFYDYLNIKIFKWKFGIDCQPRIVSILLSIGFYILAVWFASSSKII
jgi:hypothetical protein